MVNITDCIYTLVMVNGTEICPGPYDPPSTVANLKLVLPCAVFAILCCFTIVLCFKDRQEKLALIKSGAYKQVKRDTVNLRVPQLEGGQYNGVTMMIQVSNNLKKKEENNEDVSVKV